MEHTQHPLELTVDAKVPASLNTLAVLFMVKTKPLLKSLADECAISSMHFPRSPLPDSYVLCSREGQLTYTVDENNSQV